VNLVRFTYRFLRGTARECICRLRAGLVVRKLKPQIEGGAVIVGAPFLGVKISKHPTATIVLRGKLSFEPFMCTTPIYLNLAAGSRLVIEGDFSIGAGCSVFLSRDAELYIGGCKLESGAGITERSRIMVHKKVHIGTDFICSWNVFISDCDWHRITNQDIQADVFIGDHVWIAPNSSILKGTIIGNGCIVSTGAVLHKIKVPNNCLVGGVPGRVLAENRSWSREM
jgi:acetyltransferase-like isoleucine patch superfamily enzyme